MYRQLDNLLKPNNKDELLIKATLTSELKKSEVRLSGTSGISCCAGQVTFRSYLPEGQAKWLRQVLCQLKC